MTPGCWRLFICFEALCLLKESPSISTRREKKNRYDVIHLPPYLQVPHLQQSGLVSVVFLRFSSLYVHLVSLTGPNQLLVVVEQCRIQWVGVDQTDQVLSVVPPEGTQTLWGVSEGRTKPAVPSGLTRRVRPGLAESGRHMENRSVVLRHPSAPSHNKRLRDRKNQTESNQFPSRSICACWLYIKKVRKEEKNTSLSSRWRFCVELHAVPLRKETEQTFATPVSKNNADLKALDCSVSTCSSACSRAGSQSLR